MTESQNSESKDSSSSSCSNCVISPCEVTSDINEKYILQQIIGQGSFGVVRRCQSRQTKEIYAVKSIQKDKIPNVETLKREVELLSQVDHPHIIKLYDVFEDDTNIHLVTELCTGGELYDRVVEKTQSPEGHFSEYDAARIIRNILDAIAYCHNVKQIVHRDLKPENFLLLNERDDAPVKIIDFGLSKNATSGVMTSRVGTVYYVAPEVLTEDYTSKCDIWSIGVIAYVLLCGYPPFYAANERLTLKLVLEGKVEFPPSSWEEISNEAKDFIKKLLERNPKRRPTASEALKDPWLQQEKVQPRGLSRNASFVTRNDGSSTSLRMSHPKRSVFHKFLRLIKVKKASQNSSRMLDL